MNEVRPQLDELLFSSVEGVSVESVDVTDAFVQVETRSTAGRASCPGCGRSSGRIHGSYLRFPRDLPTAGKFVVVSLWVRRCVGASVRRFVCAESSCPRKTCRAGSGAHSPVRPTDGATAIDVGLGRSRARGSGRCPDDGRLRGTGQSEHPAEADRPAAGSSCRGTSRGRRG
ncbi:transposase family protein [Streptomyces sp. NPDC005402]|uniref:transposase family protein n=1 Tax=Streptomyces sp. NPDC005402 TaxID=3155338 RepID=UPI0033A93245